MWIISHISMISGRVHDYYCEIFLYCYKHHIFKKYYLRVNCPFKRDFQTDCAKLSDKCNRIDMTALLKTAPHFIGSILGDAPVTIHQGRDLDIRDSEDLPSERLGLRFGFLKIPLTLKSIK